MFCQNPGGALSHVQNLEVSRKIVNGSTNNLHLQYRLAGISDLVATEGKYAYHLRYYSKFVRQQANNGSSEECG